MSSLYNALTKSFQTKSIFLLNFLLMLLLAGSAHAQAIMCIADAGPGFETDQDTAFVTGNVLTNDLFGTRPFNALSFDTGTTSGTVSFATDIDDTATFNYDPNGQFDNLALGDSDVDVFDYTAEDDVGATDSTQVVIVVNGLNDAPVAVDDSGTGFSTGKDSPFSTGNVKTNDTDVDDGAVLSITAFDATSVGGALVTDNGDGTFGYDPNGQFAALLDGTSTTDTFTYTLSDEHGASDVATVTITVTAPAKPSGLDLVAASDSGASDTDDITKDNTPDITGSSDPLADIELTSDMDGVVGTTTADGSGNWTITTSALSDNTHSLTATAELPSGTVSGASVALVITVDTVAPNTPSVPDLDAGSDTGTSNSDDITSDNTPDFSGTSDASVLVEITSDVDGAVGSVTSTGGGTWTITASTLAEGTHAITATASDVAGNTSAASAALSPVIIDTTINDPSTPDLNVASDTGVSDTDDITSDNTPTFDGTGDIGDTVTVTSSIDGSLGTTTVDGSGNWSFTSGALADGTHDITAQSSDTAGNTSSSSAALSVVIDTAAPATPSVPDLNAADDSGVSNSDNLTNVIDPQFDGTSDPDVVVSLSSNMIGALGSTTADGSGNWSFTVTTPTLTEVTHDITATASDIAGNSSAASAALSVTVDTTAPATPSVPDLEAATDSGDSNSDDITNDNTPDFSGTSDASVIVAILSDVDGVVGSTTADGSGNWTITASTLSDAEHSITAIASDDAGNASAASTALDPVTIDTTINDPSTPDLNAGSDNGASSTDDITNDDTPTFDGTSDAGDDVVITSDVDGVLGSTTADGSGNWSFTSPALTETTHNITAQSDDVAGNVSASSAALSVTIDVSAPAAPSAPDLEAASDSGTFSNDDVTNDTTPDISGTAEANSTVSLTSDQDGPVGSATADGSGDWTVTVSPALSENTHSITATATDLAGNTGAASTALSPLVIDITPPATPTNVDLDASSDTGDFNNDNITSDTTALISGLTEAAAVVTLTSSLDGTIGTGTANGSGVFNITTNALSEGAHDITSVAVDLAGNSSGTSVLITVTIDTAAPSVPSTPDLAASSDLGSSSTDDITSDNTPTVSGTGDVGSLVRVTSDVNGFVASVIVDGAGNWSVATSALNDGTHNITATASDNSGNTSVASAALVLVIDTVAPATPPSAPDLSAGSDTGTSSTDNNTSDNTPTFTGTAAAGETVALTSSVNGSVGSAVADGSGNWSVTTSTLSDGAHNISATVTDVAGNASSASSALAVTIDTAINNPAALDLDSASDTGDSNNDDITFDNTPTITGTADAGNTVTLTSSVNGAVGSATANGLGIWSITASTLSEGAHSLTAAATDTAGNASAASSALAITVDRTVAVPAGVDLDSLSDTGSSSFDDITGDNTPTVNGTSEANATVRLTSHLNGTIGLATADGSGNWSITASAIVDGTHILTAAATDVAGNVSLSSFALSIVVDTVAPSAPLGLDLNSVSDTGSSSTDDITSDNTPTISGTAEANSTVELTSDVDGVVGSTTADGSGNWSIAASTLADGTHNLTATSTDTAGNTSASSTALTIEVDTAAPAAPLGLDLNTASDSGASDSDDITSDNTPTIDGTAEANSTVELTSDVDGVVGSATADGSGNWSITASTLADGNHNLTATSTDTAGNTSASSTALAVEIDSTAPAAPAGLDLDSASDSGSSNTDNNTSDNTPTINGTAEANSSVELTSDIDGVIGSTTADGSGHWSITATTLSEGVHSLIAATSTDTAGNTSASSAALSVTIDTAAPAAPTGLDLNAASDHGSSSTDNITNDTTPTIDGVAEAGATVELTSSVDGVVGTATADGSGHWSITTAVLSAGDHTLTATATDTAGNASGASSGLSITINTSIPAAPAGLDLESDSDTGSSDTDDITADTTPNISGTAEVGATVELTSDVDGVVGSAVADGSGNWTITTSDLSLGVHMLTAIATDVAGNESSASAALQVTIVGANLSFLWNSNLDMQNVVALRNTSDASNSTFDAILRDMSGTELGRLSSLSIAAGAELDILLETIPGFVENSFGTLTIVEDGTDNLDGHGCKYSFNADGTSQIETCSPLPSVLTGEAFLSWNTANPTQNPAKLGNPVLNFLSIANDLDTPQSFTVEVYDSTNPASVDFVSGAIANVPANGRVDLAISGAAGQLFGTVRVIPSNLSTPYRAEVARYSVADTSTLDIDFGVALEGRPGSDNDHTVPVSTSASGEDYLVITNTHTTDTNSVSVNVVAEDGTVFGPVNVNLAPYAQSHILVNSLLPAGMSGVAQITSTDPVIVDNTVYFRNSSGDVTGAYADEGRDSFGETVFESQNSFIGHGVFVKLFNVTSGSLNVDLTLNRQSGSALGMSTFTLPAGTGLTVSVNSLPYFNGPNTVGVLKAEVVGGGDDKVTVDVLRVRLDGSGNVDGIEQLSAR